MQPVLHIGVILQIVREYGVWRLPAIDIARKTISNRIATHAFLQPTWPGGVLRTMGCTGLACPSLARTAWIPLLAINFTLHNEFLNPARYHGLFDVGSLDIALARLISYYFSLKYLTIHSYWLLLLLFFLLYYSIWFLYLSHNLQLMDEVQIFSKYLNDRAGSQMLVR